MKIDLHCHSMHSKRPSLWIMQKIGCPESFTPPRELYRIMKNKGMTAVTITDHNSIDGCLEIADLPNTFLSDEVTTYFPKDKCKLHVLVYDISEAQHQDIQKARENVYDLVEYLDERQIFHVLAHPLFAVNDRLTLEHLEQCAVLFKNWELNGDQNHAANAVLRQIIDTLTPELLHHFANKHKLLPRAAEPWKKNLTGGSDDHSSLHLAETYTEVQGADTLTQFWRGIEQGRGIVHGGGASPRLMAHNIYGIAYQFYRSKLDLGQNANADALLQFLDLCLDSNTSREVTIIGKMHSFVGRQRRAFSGSPQANTIMGTLRAEAERVAKADPGIARLIDANPQQNIPREDKWLEFTNAVANRVLLETGTSLVDRLARAQVFDAFASLGGAAALYSVLAPYFVSYSMHAKCIRFAEKALRHLSGTPKPQEALRLAHFTDTYYEVNGVARTLQQHASLSAKLNLDCTIITCDAERPLEEECVRHFRPVGSFALPEYEEIAVACPPFLEMLDYCYRREFTQIHTATPGPVGLAALAISRILKLPIVGTYHTALPQYALHLTDDDGFVEDIVWKSVIWYYNQLDAVYVPSAATGDELVERGIARDRIRVYPRGIDTERFHPSKRSDILRTYFGNHDGPTLLYVGRVSREKNLPDLVAAFREISAKYPSARLLVVGDGPYREEMMQALSDTNSVFPGYIEGDTLAGVYASCDAFVFPSTTDTFGNVVLEAQASGIPVIVTDQGGPAENCIDTETAIVVPGSDANALFTAMAALLSDPGRMRSMGVAARRYADRRSFERAFVDTWQMYSDEGLQPSATPFLPMLVSVA
ncbi:MAG TPA: glycosyltransferase [Candidatus Hydrogenedentes bacterium]|nr:glycosyltransferase [Candidatus Hydrogenedentota bacterium]